MVKPPATRTSPLANKVAVCQARPVLRFAAPTPNFLRPDRIAQRYCWVVGFRPALQDRRGYTDARCHRQQPIPCRRAAGSHEWPKRGTTRLEVPLHVPATGLERFRGKQAEKKVYAVRSTRDQYSAVLQKRSLGVVSPISTDTAGATPHTSGRVVQLADVGQLWTIPTRDEDLAGSKQRRRVKRAAVAQAAGQDPGACPRVVQLCRVAEFPASVCSETARNQDLSIR